MVLPWEEYNYSCVILNRVTIKFIKSKKILAWNYTHLIHLTDYTLGLRPPLKVKNQIDKRLKAITSDDWGTEGYR